MLGKFFLVWGSPDVGYGGEANRSRRNGTFLASPGHGYILKMKMSQKFFRVKLLCFLL